MKSIRFEVDPIRHAVEDGVVLLGEKESEPLVEPQSTKAREIFSLERHAHHVLTHALSRDKPGPDQAARGVGGGDVRHDGLLRGLGLP